MIFQIKKALPYAVFFIVALVLDYIYFYGLKVGEFIFSSDQLLWFSYEEAFNNSFFIRKMDHLGVFNSWQLVVQFWDTLYYLITYALHVPMIVIEQLLYFITLLSSLILSFIGFRKMSSLFAQKEDNFILVPVALWYCLNPYTLILWHGGVYNLGLMLTYALAPLIVYYFHLSVFSDPRLKNRILCAIFLFFASFVFWLFAVMVFILVMYSILFIWIGKASSLVFLKNLGRLLIIYTPLVSGVLFLLFHEYSNNAGDLNSEFLPTFNNQQGGMWYQFLMLFSWGIYTVWVPRTLFPFGDYFLSLQYMTVTIALYSLIPTGVYLLFKNQYRTETWRLKNFIAFFRDRKNNFSVIFLILLLFSIFFAKGAQDPLGSVFLYLYNHIPFFSVFRSADHRFGFAVVLSVALLLLYTSSKFNKYIFSFTLLVLMLLQSYPMFIGTAVRGEDIEGKYFDRIIHIPDEYQQVADTINKRDDGSGYVLVFPSVQYGRYMLDADNSEEYVGQDLFPKIINKPFVYISDSTAIARKTETALRTVIEHESYQEIRKFPIRYIILRKDVPCPKCLNIPELQANQEFTNIFQNKSFVVYEIPGASPLVDATDAYFKMINPTKFQVELKHIGQLETLRLGLSFHKGWKVYLNEIDKRIICDTADIREYSATRECVDEKKFFEGNELHYLFGRDLFDPSHVVDKEYANAWTIDVEFIRQHYGQEFYSINDDGTINLNLTIYYQPQSWLYLYSLISILTLVACGVVLLMLRSFQNDRE